MGNLKAFAENSTIHGVSYILNRNVRIFERFMWLIIFSSSCFLAVFLSYSSYTNWQENQVITTLKTVAKPVHDLKFPAVTICAAGQYMDNVEKVLYNNFRKWNENQDSSTRQAPLENRIARYMKETFQITNPGMSILDVLNMMVSPSDEASNAEAVKQNQVACSKKHSRKKRSTFDGFTSKDKHQIFFPCLVQPSAYL